MSDDLTKLNISGREPVDDITEIPSQRAEDVAHELTKLAIAGVPIAGPAAARLFETALIPPYTRRRNEWIQSIAVRVVRLEQEGRLKLEELAANDMFVSAVAQAWQAATRTHQREKHEALRNAVFNSIAPGAPDESWQMMFIAFIDDFTEWHLLLLRFADQPEAHARRQGYEFGEVPIGQLSTDVERVFEDLRGRSDFYGQVWRDLYSRGLVTYSDLQALNSRRDPLVTAVGKQFLQYISAPPNNLRIRAARRPRPLPSAAASRRTILG